MNMLSSLELEFLKAAADLAERQRELYPLLLEALGTDPWEFLIVRDMAPRIKSDGVTRDGSWRWWFHGLECDMEHRVDGRYVRFDFGPSKNKLTVGHGYGVLQFVMCSRPPWVDYVTLREHLASDHTARGHLGGDHAKMSILCNRLTEAGLLVQAAPELVALADKYTTIEPNQGHIVAIPDDLAPSGALEHFVARRLVLSDAAAAVLSGEAIA